MVCGLAPLRSLRTCTAFEVNTTRPYVWCTHTFGYTSNTPPLALVVILGGCVGLTRTWPNWEGESCSCQAPREPSPAPSEPGGNHKGEPGFPSGTKRVFRASTGLWGLNPSPGSRSGLFPGETLGCRPGSKRTCAVSCKAASQAPFVVFRLRWVLLLALPQLTAHSQQPSILEFLQLDQHTLPTRPERSSQALRPYSWAQI